MDRLISNHFDQNHNYFGTTRRVPDVWEWGNNVLWPGLFGDIGPCGTSPGSRSDPKTCIDNVWPDGEGEFSTVGATPFTVPELVERMDAFDWTDGMLIRVSRAPSDNCAVLSLGKCYPDLSPGQTGTTEPYGYNWTDPSSPPEHPFVHWTSAQLGANPEGMKSASFASMKEYDASGYVALVMPFFSDTYLPPEEGTADQVTDFRKYRAKAWGKGTEPERTREPRYHCVRLSPNGLHVRQLCDPGSLGNGNGTMTGAVRNAVEVMWNDLKRAHFIDHRARVMTLTLHLMSHYIGVRYRLTLMFEFTATGAVFSSYDVETRPLGRQSMDSMEFYANFAFAMVHRRRSTLPPLTEHPCPPHHPFPPLTLPSLLSRSLPSSHPPVGRRAPC
jgi:hypothetical protein